jgi:hypothetical protein
MNEPRNSVEQRYADDVEFRYLVHDMACRAGASVANVLDYLYNTRSEESLQKAKELQAKWAEAFPQAFEWKGKVRRSVSR